MGKVSGLSKLYAEHKLYPVISYSLDSPVRVFQRLFPEDHYTKDIDEFFKLHNYNPVQRGSDLPWWGESYFSNQSGTRCMIISQDSLAENAGSVVFFAHLMKEIHLKEDYIKFTNQLSKNQRFRYGSWSRIRKQIIEWGIQPDYLFVTDAAKVYREDSWKSFDRKKSRDLLKEEIHYCKPDLLILLGGSPLSLLSDLSYSTVVELGEYITVCDVKTVVTPFPSGNGLTQLNFKNRMINATKLIKQFI